MVGYGTLVAATLYAGWAGDWSIVGRVARHQFAFGAQLLCTALVAGVSTVAVEIPDYAEFIFSTPLASEIGYYAVGIFVTTLLVKLNLDLATNVVHTTRAGLVVSLVLAGLFFFSVLWSKNDFSYGVDFADATKPPFAAIVSPVTVEEFLGSVRALEPER